MIRSVSLPNYAISALVDDGKFMRVCECVLVKSKAFEQKNMNSEYFENFN
jgi:hypothetical protein